MKIATLKLLIKWTWIAAVGIFIVYYGYTRKDVILNSLSMLSMPVILLATICIILAKLCLAENMRLASVQAGLRFSYPDCYRIYNITQLGKYIPGSIWQFVGRIAVLRERGASAKTIRDSIMAEQIWVLLTAFIFGTVLVLLFDSSGRIGGMTSRFMQIFAWQI
ncbi:MAG: hypothetical protein ACYC4Q_11775, partial [Victivallaceae bacterium]